MKQRCELIVGENLSIRVVLKLHILNTTRPRMNVPIHWFGVDGRPFPVKINMWFQKYPDL